MINLFRLRGVTFLYFYDTETTEIWQIGKKGFHTPKKVEKYINLPKSDRELSVVYEYIRDKYDKSPDCEILNQFTTEQEAIEWYFTNYPENFIGAL